MKKNKESFETLILELEKIIDSFETKDLSLEESLKNYELGTEIYKKANKIIKESEIKINLLNQKIDDGEDIDENI